MLDLFNLLSIGVPVYVFNMFQLENESQVQFYNDAKEAANLDEEQLKILEAYQKNVYLSRHIELQILDWENSRFFDDLSQHEDNKTLVIEEVDDIKHKCETTEKNLVALAEYQNSLNEQINGLMLFKQPVQHETTYLMTNRRYDPFFKDNKVNNPNLASDVAQSKMKNPKITTKITGTLSKSKSHSKMTNIPNFTDNVEPNLGNVYLSPTSTNPKLTYNAFTKQLYSCDSVRIEHILKNENDLMLNGLINLERSIHKIINEIDTSDIDEDTKYNMITVDTLIDKINEYDRLSYLTIIEHLNLKKKLFHIDSEKSNEVKNIFDECKIIENKIDNLQKECQQNLLIMKQRYKQEHENTIKQLDKQKSKLTAKLMFLNKRQYQLNHPLARRHQNQRKVNLFGGNGIENKNPNINQKQLLARGTTSTSNANNNNDDTEVKDIQSRLMEKVQDAKEK